MSAPAVLAAAGHDVLTAVAGVAVGAVLGGAGGFAAALYGRARPGRRVVDGAAVPVAVAVALAVVLIAGPGLGTILTLVAVVTVVSFGSRTRRRAAEAQLWNSTL